MLDMCQLSNRLTEHKYYGTYPQLADTIGKYSSAPLLDIQRFWEVVLFSWLTGNSDMHCKNFSLVDMGGRKSGFTREDFLGAMTSSGISAAVAQKLLERLVSFLPEWEELVDASFLPEELKSSYKDLLKERIRRLTK